MDEAVDGFMAFTGASVDVARRYLGLTDNNAEQAIQLFFDSPDLATGLNAESQPSAPPVPTSTRPRAADTAPLASRSRQRAPPNDGSDDGEDMDLDHDEDEDEEASTAEALGRAADYEDDEAMARRMQEELYAGGDASGGFDADGVRAPLGRVTETLVDETGDWGHDDMHAAVLQQMRARRNGGAGSSMIRPSTLV
jgi:hypothetical protein